MMRKMTLLCWLVMCLVMPGCGDGSDDPGINRMPVAAAGNDQNVTSGTLVTLDGSASTDPDGDLLSYTWNMISAPVGSAASLSDPTVVRPTFTPDIDGDYRFTLVVNDGELDSATDSVTITMATANSAPTANAGVDQNVTVATLVTLDGSASSDADSDLLTYQWAIVSMPPGSSAALTASTTVSSTFTPDVAGSYVISLVVNDGTVDSTIDTVTITAAVANSAPIADAGTDQSVSTGALVTLDGTASSDADSAPLTYQWTLVSLPTGSSAVLSDETGVNPTFIADLFGDYVVSLVVNDGLVDSVPDTVTVTTRFQPPSTSVALNFTIDDTANQTYDSSDGLAWKGSFQFNPASRVLSFDGSWGGPYVLLYDDGPWDSGGHEPAGATAGDHIWGVTVWVNNSGPTTFEYGAIRGSIDGSDGEWIWSGSNGVVNVAGGATDPIDATGLVIPAHGTVNLMLTIDISANGASLAAPFQGVDYSNQVEIKGSAWSWNAISCTDDGTLGDVTAGDGIYTFLLSEHLGKHEGLLYSGDQPEFLFVLGGIEYREGGAASPVAISAFVDSGSGWVIVPTVSVQADGAQNTFIDVP